MRDLIVTNATPNVKSGSGLRTYGVTAALARDHDVDIAYIAFGWDAPAPAYAALASVHLRSMSASRGAGRILEYARARRAGVPDSFARGVSPEMRSAAAAAADDVRVIADGLIPAAALLRLARTRPIVYLAHNLESSFRPEGASLRGFERTLLQSFEETWMATRADEAGGVRLAGDGIRTRYVPNVIDVERITPLTPTGSDRVIFVGDFTYPPNRGGLAFLADEVLPRVWARRPSLRVAVVGRGLTDPPADSRIEVLGFVEDLQAEYAQADAVLVPLLEGGGSPLKFVEALAYGLPVLATAHAAALIEDGRSGEHFLSAADPDAFAAALETVLGDPSLARRLGAAGRELAASRYSVTALARQLAD